MNTASCCSSHATQSTEEQCCGWPGAPHLPYIMKTSHQPPHHSAGLDHLTNGPPQQLLLLHLVHRQVRSGQTVSKAALEVKSQPAPLRSDITQHPSDSHEVMLRIGSGTSVISRLLRSSSPPLLKLDRKGNPLSIPWVFLNCTTYITDHCY